MSFRSWKWFRQVRTVILRDREETAVYGKEHAIVLERGRRTHTEAREMNCSVLGWDEKGKDMGAETLHEKSIYSNFSPSASIRRSSPLSKLNNTAQDKAQSTPIAFGAKLADQCIEAVGIALFRAFPCVRMLVAMVPVVNE